MTALDPGSLDLRAAIRETGRGLILKPILRNYLYDARFPDFDMRFRNHAMEREPDGWFHPSTHPLWPERQLYHYLAHPELMRVERKDYMGALSVTVGRAMHGFIGVCLTDAGVMPAELQRCRSCPPGGGCRAPGEVEEPGVQDVEAGERGHMDGLLDLSRLPLPGPEYESPVFEFKTTNSAKLRKLADLDLDGFRATWPEYHAQQMPYQRMSWRRMTVVLVMALGYPWDMREFHVPYDRGLAVGVRDKYLRVRQAVADQRPPRDCCGSPRSCPAGLVCDRVAR